MLTILNFDEKNPNDKDLAEFSVALTGGITFNRLKVRRSAKGTKFIAYPSYCVENSEGEKKWHRYVEMAPEKRQDFERKLWEALEPFLRID